jgi:uncharacterized protein (DUF433 family)
MDKQLAIAKVNEHLGYRLLDGRNTRFANVNASKPVWWLNIPPGKFKKDLHLLLVTERQDSLIWLKIEAHTFPVPDQVFRWRQDKGQYDLELSSRHPLYLTDVKSGGAGYDFTKHIEHEWQLAAKDSTTDEIICNSNESANKIGARITVHVDQPCDSDRASWFAKTREDSKKLFGHLASGRNLESFLNQNPSVGKGWSMSALHMARQVLDEVAYREPNHLVHSDRQIMGGEPVFLGTRLPIAVLFDCLRDNFTLAKFVDDFPTGDVEQSAKVLLLASEILVKESMERETRENESHVDLPR